MGNKCLKFILKQELYAIEIEKVIDIFAMKKITELPRTPDYIMGVINLRGKIIPVIDLRLRLSFEFLTYHDRTNIIVVDVSNEKEKKEIGVIVDKVLEVFEIDLENFQSSNQYNIDIKEEFISGVGKVDEEVVILLNVDKVLESTDKKILENMEVLNV